MHDHDGDWRWTQWTIALIGAPIWISILFMKETADFRVSITSQGSGTTGIVRHVLSTLKAAIVRSMTILTTELIAIAVTLYTGYAYAVIFSFFASISYVYSKDYGFNPREASLAVIAVIIGYLLATALQMVFEKRLAVRAARKGQVVYAVPEERLYTAMVGSIFLPVGLFW
jgi:hypothetical protein